MQAPSQRLRKPAPLILQTTSGTRPRSAPMDGVRTKNASASTTATGCRRAYTTISPCQNRASTRMRQQSPCTDLHALPGTMCPVLHGFHLAMEKTSPRVRTTGATYHGVMLIRPVPTARVHPFLQDRTQPSTVTQFAVMPQTVTRPVQMGQTGRAPQGAPMIPMAERATQRTSPLARASTPVRLFRPAFTLHRRIPPCRISTSMAQPVLLGIRCPARHGLTAVPRMQSGATRLTTGARSRGVT
mmetsp:Transcript_46938/g.105506  ORF Transcript_46938/g.105506 Transcript_46938/m.105506 type:complete len:243 (-) Transcript_46938:2549-3277(-)